ncbi:MAG: RIP metalloprotease RseP [Calditrichia bacterium]
MIYLLSIIFVLSILVFFHELGHFMFAKLFGVRVDRFSIGFPPRLIGFKLGETDYCISAIPFGGYVKMAGVVDESMDSESLTGAPDEFASKKWWQKVLILIGGVTMNMILAWVIISGILHFEGEPMLPSTTVGQVVEGGISEEAGLQTGDQIISVNGEQVTNWNDISQAYIANLGSKITFTVKRSGRETEVVFDKNVLQQKNSDMLDIFPLIPARVGEIQPDSPADHAGLQRGDRIVRIKGQPVNNWNEMTDLIQENAEKSLQIEILRESKTISKTLTPESTSIISEDGSEKVVGKIGIGVYYDKREIGVFPALAEGFQRTWFFTTMNIKALSWLVTGKKSAKEMLGGPIMITKMAGDFAKSGFTSLMELIAHLSIMLAIVNILPIPALDGGHITITLIEEIRRKPLSLNTKVKIQQVGMAILFVLIIFVMYNDILRLL